MHWQFFSGITDFVTSPLKSFQWEERVSDEHTCTNEQASTHSISASACGPETTNLGLSYFAGPAFSI
jgi:hypothetical protein